MGWVGAINQTTRLTAGSGYAEGDTGFINQGGNITASYIAHTLGGDGVAGFDLSNGGGSGYTSPDDGPISTITGGPQPGVGTGFTISIQTSGPGAIFQSEISGGDAAGYTAGDILTINQAGSSNSATLQILTVDGDGVPLTYTLPEQGYTVGGLVGCGYLTTLAEPVTITGGSGSGMESSFSIQVVSTGSDSTHGPIRAYTITDPGTGYSDGDTGRFFQGVTETYAFYGNTVTSGGGIVSFDLDPADGFTVGEATTIGDGPQPGSGSGFTINVTNVSPCGSMPNPRGFIIYATALNDGSFLVAYNSGGEANVVRYFGGWSGDTTSLGSGTNRLMVCAAPGTGGAFILYEDTNDNNYKIVYQDASLALSTPSIVVSTAGVTLLGSIINIGPNLMVPYISGGLSMIVAVADSTVPGGSLSFVPVTVGISQEDSSSGWIDNVPDVDGDHPTVVFSNNGNLNISYSRDGEGDDWSSPTVLVPGYSVGGQFFAIGQGKAGFIYYGSGSDLNTYYDIFTLPSSVQILTATIPDTQLNTPYNYTLTGTGVEPTTWAVVAGTLPPGLSLSITGVLTGTPTMAGVFNFQIQLTDSFGNSAIAPFTVTVGSQTPPGGVSPWIPGPLWSVDQACAKTGQYGLQRVADGIIADSSTTSSQAIPVTPGQNWFIEFFLKNSNPEVADANGIVGYGFTWYDANGNALSNSVIFSSGNSRNWAMFIGTITAPANAVTAKPIIQAIGHTAGTWCVNALFTVELDSYFIISSIKHYYDSYVLYRSQL